MVTYIQALMHACKRRAGERGQVLVLSAFGLVALLGMTGLAIDVGIATIQRRQAQNAADAAALAGADDLPGSPGTPTNAETTAASSDASTQAGLNGFSAGGTVTIAVNTPPTTGKHAGDSHSVQVVITKQVSTFFLGVLNQNRIKVTAQAVATAPPGAAKCALCILDANASGALINNGNPTVKVQGAGIVVDSSSNTAAIFNGSPSVSATTFGIVGSYISNGGVTLSPTPTTTTAVPDPLAGVPVPSVSGTPYPTQVNNGSGTLTLSPGIYGTIINNGNGTINLNPGVYVITGQLILNGSPTIVGTGVTLYFTCSGYSASNTAPCNGSSGAGLTLNGSPTYQLTAPTSSTCSSAPSTCPYVGLTVFYDRGNKAPLVLNGGPSDNFTGTVYAKSAQATLNGNPGDDQLNSLIVVDTATLNGSGTLTLNFDSSQNYPVPPATGTSDLTE